jgi:hypothetical protein
VLWVDDNDAPRFAAHRRELLNMLTRLVRLNSAQENRRRSKMNPAAWVTEDQSDYCGVRPNCKITHASLNFECHVYTVIGFQRSLDVIPSSAATDWNCSRTASNFSHHLPHSSRMSLDGSAASARPAGMADAAIPSSAIVSTARPTTTGSRGFA